MLPKRLLTVSFLSRMLSPWFGTCPQGKLRRVVTGLCLVAFLLVLAEPQAGSEASAAVKPPSEIGQWEGPYPWPLVGVHAALLRTGKVLHYSYGNFGKETAWLWDPTANPPTAGLQGVPIDRDIFCSGHSFLPDGRLLVTGGNTQGPNGEGCCFGIQDTHLFDPETESWTALPSMARGRWYPTNVSLPDGRVLVFSGLDETGNYNETVEIYTPGSGWELISGADKFLDLYPFMHLLPSGKVVHTGPESLTQAFDLNGPPFWEDVGATHFYHYSGTSVLLPGLSRVLVLGGRRPAELINFAEPLPAWREPLQRFRRPRHSNAVLLPDGNVLVAGGGRKAAMFYPTTETWRRMARLFRPRKYHSTMLLLPDGRVMAAGRDGEYTAEIYSPPYLFRGPRPTIASVAPASFGYGDTFTVESPEAADVGSVVLIRPSAVTHSVNMEQRYVDLAFSATGSTLTVTGPPDPNQAPPGYYMLFLVNTTGVPSVATFVHLPVP